MCPDTGGQICLQVSIVSITKFHGGSRTTGTHSQCSSCLLSTLQDFHLMTDRTSHMRYLEAQLERMNAACSTVQTFDCKIEDMCGGLAMLQDKVVNLARMLDTHSHSVESTATAFRQTAADLSRKQQVVHDLLFGGSAQVCMIPITDRFVSCDRYVS
jgi:hypothetical protein